MRAPHDPYAGMTDEETQKAINEKYSIPHPGHSRELVDAVAKMYSGKISEETGKTPKEILDKVNEVTNKMISGQASEEEAEQAFGLLNFLKSKFMRKEAQTKNAPAQKGDN